VVGRAALRLVLGGYCGIDPARVELGVEEGSAGKPVLVGPSPAELQFNLSHSDWLAVIVVTSGIPIGVDVERTRDIGDAHQIAERFFAESEREALRRAPDAEASRLFLKIWTRKEAYVKGIGRGLQAPLNGFEVSLLEHGGAELHLLDGRKRDRSGWVIYPFTPRDGFIAALACPGPARSLRLATYRPTLDDEAQVSACVPSARIEAGLRR
jgi:4'-phosphopantetheinyl transferase